MPVALGVNGGVLGSNNLPTATTFRGVFTPNEVARAISLGFWPVNKSQAVTGVAGSGALGTLTVGATADPYFEYTTLLLPGNGTNGAQNNTFLDGSTNNFTITRNGNTTQGTFSPFSQTGWGNYFKTGTDAITSASSSGFAFGTGNYTIEAQIYWSGSSSEFQITGSSSNNFNLYVNATTIGFYDGTSGITRTTTISKNTWLYIALVRSGGSLTFYLNGSAVGSTTASSTNYSAFQLIVGRNTAAGTSWADGYISNLRISNVARTISSTPTSAYTQDANTVFLLGNTNRFLDQGVNGLTLTITGTPSVVAFSPFNPTASWSAATYGGSGYFDGSGDSLSVASNTALQLTGEFTMEAWYYPLGFPGSGLYDCLLTTGDNSLSNAIAIYINSSGGIQLYNHVTNAAIFNTASGVVLNAWNHIAATRNSSNGVDLWLNGVSQGSTVTVSSSFTSTTPTRIGTSSTNQDCYGYIGSTRIVKGTAVYTSAFTPPTAPLTAITNTSLLLNFTNAGIYDATSKNDLETVGNAQISTAISAKWGSGSMAFDGNGDWLAAPTSILPQFGTGDFTIEFWWYPNSLATAQQIISNTNDSAVAGSGEFVITYNTSLGLRFYINAGAVDIQQGSTTGWTTGQWYYVAAVRSGNTLTLYRNGSSIASGSVTGITIGANVPFYIGGEPTQPTSINGYLQDVRITKGYARTVTTSPTAAFPTL